MTSRSASPVAITREPSATLAECELSFVSRQPIDLGRTRMIVRRGFAVRELDIRELQKAEEWLTCLSLMVGPQ
ncbi:MAG: hypothetical protein ACREOQ_14680 [Gemmatimonadales bacterium]